MYCRPTGQVEGINVLPDDVLLKIFDFNADMCLSSYGGRRGIGAWQSLVHVCRRWRSLVFESPPRLNLRLYCAPETPTKDALDVWPALPLTVWGQMTVSGAESIIAALKLSRAIAYVKSPSSTSLRLGNWNKSWPRRRCHSWS